MSLRIPLTAALACLLANVAIANAGPETRALPASPAPPLTQVVYPVGDLITSPAMVNGKKPGTTGEGRLMELLSTRIAPKSWSEMGGAGRLQFYPIGMVLVVNQTKEVQKEVAALLKTLRRLQDIQVAVEFRIITTSPEMGAKFRAKAEFVPCKEPGTPKEKACSETVKERMERTLNETQGAEHLKREWDRYWTVDDPRPPAASAKTTPTAFFTVKELYPWMELLQADPATSIMQSPKATTISGQTAMMRIGQKESIVEGYQVERGEDGVTLVPQYKELDLGTSYKFQPIVSADRRFVRLKLDFRQTAQLGETSVPVSINIAEEGAEEKIVTRRIQQPNLQTMAVKHAATIADGQTMAVSLGRYEADVHKESAPCVLSGIPYLNRLFRTVGYGRETREMFLLVTPRIIVIEEEELPAVSLVPRP